MIDKKMHGINGFKVIQMDFQKVEWEGVECIKLAEDMDRWHVS